MSNVFGRIKYYINEDKGTVVAKFNGHYRKDCSIWCRLLGDVLDKIGKDTKKNTNICGEQYKTLALGMDSYSDEIDDYIYCNDRLYGLAKCTPEDKFDVEIGKEIARKKLLAKYFKFEKKMLQIAHNMYAKFATEYFANLEKRIELCDYKIKKNTVKV